MRGAGRGAAPSQLQTVTRSGTGVGGLGTVIGRLGGLIRPRPGPRHSPPVRAGRPSADDTARPRPGLLLSIRRPSRPDDTACATTIPSGPPWTSPTQTSVPGPAERAVGSTSWPNRTGPGKPGRPSLRRARPALLVGGDHADAGRRRRRIRPGQRRRSRPRPPPPTSARRSALPAGLPDEVAARRGSCGDTPHPAKPAGPRRVGWCGRIWAGPVGAWGQMTLGYDGRG